MIPLWAHGFFSKSTAYGAGTNAIDALDKYVAAKYPI